ELDLDLRRDVAAARCAAAHASAEEIVAEERAEEIADVAEVEVPRREAAGPQPRMAIAVVQLARLRVREHLVRLGDLAEAHLRIGLLGDIRVKLPGQAAERFLDLLLVGLARDAEQLVVVVVARRHASPPRRPLRRTATARARRRARSGAPFRSPSAVGRAG